MGRLVKRGGRLLPGEVLDARGQANVLLRGAQDEAARLVSAAQREAEALREQARRLGEAQGRADAEAAFTHLLVAARADAERVRAAALPAARTLALRMAEKIVGRTIVLDPGALTDIAAAALAAARARTGVVLLRVNPTELAALEAARPALVARLAAGVDLRLVPDTSVASGGCIVETPGGRLDARLATQLAALQRALYGDEAAETDRETRHD